MSEDIKNAIKELNEKQDNQTEKLISLAENTAKHSISLEFHGKMLNEISTNIKEINTTMTRNTASLEYHIERTNLLEKKLEPVEKHVHGIELIIKVILAVITASAAVTAIVKVFN